jgi:hypothetical protein
MNRVTGASKRDDAFVTGADVDRSGETYKQLTSTSEELPTGCVRSLLIFFKMIDQELTVDIHLLAYQQNKHSTTSIRNRSSGKSLPVPSNVGPGHIKEVDVDTTLCHSERL